MSSTGSIGERHFTKSGMKTFSSRPQEKSIRLEFSHKIYTHILKEMESKLSKFVRSKSVSYEAYLDHVNLRQRQHEKNTVFLNVHTPDYDALSCQVPRSFNCPHQHFLAKSPFRKNEDNHEPDASGGNTRSDKGWNIFLAKVTFRYLCNQKLTPFWTKIKNSWRRIRQNCAQSILASHYYGIKSSFLMSVFLLGPLIFQIYQKWRSIKKADSEPSRART